MKLLPGKFQHFRWLGLCLALAFSCSAQAGQGVLGEYYPDVRFQGARVVRIDPTVDFNFDGDPNRNTLPPGFTNNGGEIEDTISIRWTGQVLTTVAGTYTFACASDDGSRLWVNGKLLVKTNWRDQGETQVTGTIDLAANTLYSIRMEGYQGGGGVSFRMRWQPPGGTLEIIPATNLIPAPQTNQGGGLLVSSPVPAAIVSPVNLTTDGPIDWIHWGRTNNTGRNRKATGGEFINDYAQQGVAGTAVAAATGTASFSWTDGSTTGDVAQAVVNSAAITNMISQGNNTGDGFEITAPADMTPRRLRVYVKSLAQALTVEASLSDFSAPVLTQTLAANSERVFTFIYRANTPGQMITVRSVTSGNAGPSQLFAATIGNPVPTTTNQALSTNEDTNLPIILTATDPEGQALTFVITTPPSNGNFLANTPRT